MSFQDDKTLIMKKLMIMLTTAALPFLLVWAAFFLTAFSFNPVAIFQEGSFWGISCIYWLLWVCIAPMIVELVDEELAKSIEKKI